MKSSELRQQEKTRVKAACTQNTPHLPHLEVPTIVYGLTMVQLCVVLWHTVHNGSKWLLYSPTYVKKCFGTTTVQVQRAVLAC